MRREHSRSGRRRLIIAGFGLLLVLAALGAVLVRDVLERDAGDSLEPFLSDWSAGRDRAAASRTNAPQVAAVALRANRRGLDGARLEAGDPDVSERGDRAIGTVRLAWRVPGIGTWGYDVRIPLHRVAGEWQVHWTPGLVHPGLEEGERLGTTRLALERAAILDRRGEAIVRPRRVVRIGAVVSEVARPRATAEGLADALGVDARPILRQLRGGGPQQFVEAIVLRPDDYARLRPELDAVPDATAVKGTAPLAPTREFARALLGIVAPVTAEQLERLGPAYAAGDQVGQWGLQARFERQLAGTATRRVVVRNSDGVAVRTLFERTGRPGRPLRTTLDARVQAAAEAALGGRAGGAALVAVEPASGDLLAVANRPVDSSFNRAFEGRYPPGSTFKVVTTAALLRAGLDVRETVNCPRTISVDGRVFRNFEGAAAGPVPFSEDFAQSCNTAFVSLATRLSPEALSRTAHDFGLGRRIHLPLPAPPAEVPPARTAVERAAAMIGQHEIVASPLSMAGVAATVAAGRWQAPRLLADDEQRSGRRLPAPERKALAGLMRTVVAAGTGTALAGVAGEPAGKTGTAEYGAEDPPRTHAWFIAYRGPLALSVLVENGSSGGSVAAPIAAAFFDALDRG